MSELKNTPVVVDGEERWLSRSEVCSTVVFAQNADEQLCVLANLRGKGCEFLPDKWNIPGGFIDYGETERQCAARECFEECGLKLNHKQLLLFNIDDDPERSRRQNITHTFMVVLPNKCETYELSAENSEPDEVADIRWIPVNEIFNYKWTNHKQTKLIQKALNIKNMMLHLHLPFDLYEL